MKKIGFIGLLIIGLLLTITPVLAANATSHFYGSGLVINGTGIGANEVAVFSSYDIQTSKVLVNELARRGYDAIVYQNATYTIAVDKDGNILGTPVTISSKTDNVPIQAAITYVATLTDHGGLADHGVTYIVTGDYHLAAKITMHAGVDVICNAQGTYFHIENDFGDDIILMAPHTVWDGGYFYIGIAPYTTEFTHSGFVFLGTTPYAWTRGSQGIKNVVLNNQASAASAAFGTDSKAINLYTVDVASSMINAVTVENIQIAGYWDYGIYMAEVGTNQYYETMSWNVFRDIWFTRTKHAVYMYTPGVWNVMDSNLFENMYIQTGGTAPFNVDGFTISGENNQLVNTNPGDWSSATSYEYVITAKAENTTMIRAWVERNTTATKTVSNSGARTQWIASPGWKTANEGATATVADGGAITHGMSLTPTWCTATPSVTNETVSVVTLDTAHFHVDIKKILTGATGTTQTIYWRCGT